MGTEISPYDPSPEALRPLMDTFWSPQGWRRPPAWPASNVMRQAVAAGVMFEAPLQHSHDAWVHAAQDAVRGLSPGEVSNAFLASLTSRRLDLRSALGSYAVARHLPEHEYVRKAGTGCAVCGLYLDREETQDANVLSFERFKWGGVRRVGIEYVTFDLQQFAHAPQLRPSTADIGLAQRVIDTLRTLPPSTTAAQAVAHLKMIPGNKAQREILIDILGVCGILSTATHPGYDRSFIPYTERPTPDQRYIFGSYPTSWWTAADGINGSALLEFLPQLH